MLGFEGIGQSARALPHVARVHATFERLFVSFQRWLRSSEPVQYFLCALLGAAVGTSVAGLQRLIDGLHRLSFKLPLEHTLSAGIGVDRTRILIVPAIGGLFLGLVSLIVRRYRKSEIVDPIEANALHGGRMSMIDSVRLLVSTIVSNAAGASVGMEAGYSQFGSAVFASIGRYFRLRRADQRIFVTSGAAAAIAAAFNAPLAGAFYGYELIQGNYAIRALAPVALASLTATMTERALVIPEPLFVVGQFHFKQSLYLLFALEGLIAAGFSIFAMQAVTWTERGWKSTNVPAWIRPMIGGIMLSLVALVLPQVLGSGHGEILYQSVHSWALVPVAALLMAKLFASSISIGSGFRGGMFSSSLLLGCLFGAVFADVAAIILPRLAIQHAAFMMVGMGSVAAGVIGGPLTMTFLVLEGTGDFPMTVGVMVGVIICSTIVRLTFGYSFSTWRFHQRGIGIKSPHDIGWISDLTAESLMRSDPHTVKGALTLADLRDQYPVGSAKRLFVVDDEDRYVGLIEVSALHDMRKDYAQTTTAADLARNNGRFLVPHDNVRTALHRFEDWQVETLPVLASRGERRVVGYLTEAYALRRYKQELERRRSAELGERDLFSISEPQD